MPNQEPDISGGCGDYFSLKLSEALAVHAEAPLKAVVLCVVAGRGPAAFSSSSDQA